MRALTIAIGTYGLTRAMKEGGVSSDRLSLEYVEVSPITSAMRRMARTLAFDICEMAFATYLCAKGMGRPITALPIFLTRNFHHWAVFHNVAAGLRGPKDLEGRKIAVNRGYTVTTGVWVRGILASEYGVDLDKITWMPTDEEHVAEYHAPANVDYAWRGRAIGELLSAQACDAGIGDIRADSPAIQPLIPEARQAGFAWYRRIGIYPVNHAVVVRDDVLAEFPWLARELVALFEASKARYLRDLASGAAQAPADAAAREVGAVVGGDPFPYGIAANRKAIEAIAGFAFDQRVTPEKFSVERLFAAETLAQGGRR